jgi:hypothetical protein
VWVTLGKVKKKGRKTVSVAGKLDDKVTDCVVKLDVRRWNSGVFYEGCRISYGQLKHTGGIKLLHKSLWKKPRPDYSLVRVAYTDEEVQVYSREIRYALYRLEGVYLDVLSDSEVISRLVGVLLLHLGQRGFWYRFPFLVSCRKQLLICVRNFVIDIKRWSDRKHRIFNGNAVWDRVKSLPYYPLDGLSYKGEGDEKAFSDA